jgi:predicted PurR-regulated permease PerM
MLVRVLQNPRFLLLGVLVAAAALVPLLGTFA